MNASVTPAMREWCRKIARPGTVMKRHPITWSIGFRDPLGGGSPNWPMVSKLEECGLISVDHVDAEGYEVFGLTDAGRATQVKGGKQ